MPGSNKKFVDGGQYESTLFQSEFLKSVPRADGVSAVAMNADSVSSAGQEILEVINSFPFNPDLTPEEVRKVREIWGNPWDHPDAQSVRHRDIQIPLATKKLRARIYYPESSP